jgi:DNA polymerase-3 subunit beta
MKFETILEEFSSAITTLARFAERRTNLPVLSTILITAENGRLLLRATNLECGAEMSVSAKVTGEATAAIPANTLSGFLNNARGKNVSVSLKGEVVKVETQNSSALIKTLPHDDFPLLPRVSADHSFHIKAADLVRAIRSVVHCASLSAVKPELQSVLLYADAGKLIAVATDSFRLAEKTVPQSKGGSVPHLLLPARNATELMRILENMSGDIEVYYNEHQLLDGTFPNYRQIIPKDFSTEAVVLREELGIALKSLSVFADKFAQVSLTIEPSKKAILLTSRNPDVGEQTSTLKATIKGEGMTVSFNSRYLADSLQSIAGDSVRLHSSGPGKAMLIKDATDASFLYLAMPMNR